MRLLCPNCAKELQVPDQYAGQMMKCPLCNGTFTVPTLPTMPSAATMPPPPPPPMVSAPAAPAPATPSYAPAPQPAGPQQTLSVSPKLINWLAPICLLAMLILLFFPWVGMYPANVPVLTQTGWQAAFGRTTPNSSWKNYSTKEKYWKAYYGDDVTPLEEPGASGQLILFSVLLILALLFAIPVTLISTGLLKIPVPPALNAIWPMRYLIIAGLAAACLALLILQLWGDFPLEHKAYDQVKALVEAARTNPLTSTAEQQDAQRWEMELGIRLGGYAIRTTAWLSLVVVLNIVAVVGALLQFRLERAGGDALPSIQLRR